MLAPLVAGAQQPVMPVIGFLHPTSPDAFPDRLRGFRLGLRETGYVEGENVTITYRFAEESNRSITDDAVELVNSRVAVIAAANSPSALAAKAATTTIPVVFISPEDPVRLGLLTSLAKPGGNLSGINLLSGELVAKRLELLHELVPGASSVAVLVNPANATTTETTLRDVEVAARAIGLQSNSSKLVPAMRSTRHSQFSHASELTLFLSAMTPFSPPGAYSWRSWRRITRFRRPMGRAKSPRLGA